MHGALQQLPAEAAVQLGDGLGWRGEDKAGWNPSKESLWVCACCLSRLVWGGQALPGAAGGDTKSYSVFRLWGRPGLSSCVTCLEELQREEPWRQREPGPEALQPLSAGLSPEAWC